MNDSPTNLEDILQRLYEANVDFVLPLPGGVDSFAGLKERATLLEMGDFSVWIASINDLIAMKQAANRPKDQTYLKQLLALQKMTGETTPGQ